MSLITAIPPPGARHIIPVEFALEYERLTFYTQGLTQCVDECVLRQTAVILFFLRENQHLVFHTT